MMMLGSERVSWDPSTDHSINHLIAAAKKDGGSSLGRLCEVVTPKLFAGITLRLRQLAPTSIQPEDVVQETWSRALLRLDEFHPPGSFTGWLFAFAKNVLFELRRLEKRCGAERFKDESRSSGIFRFESTPDEVTSVSKRVIRSEAVARLIASMADADAIDREIFVLSFVEELDHETISKRLSLSNEAVRKRRQRLRDRLRLEGAESSTGDA